MSDPIPSDVPGDYTVLLQAISNCTAPVVHQLMRQNPQLVHIAGWHGQTPLHKACLGGDWTIIYLLLEARADSNICNNFSETPLHCACRRGLVSNVHLLIQHSGDIRAIDKQGKGVIHHAALSGSVYVLHYLSAVHGVSTTSVDHTLESPLHIACQMGHLEAFKYLIKYERSDIFQRNMDGNTPLHLAAKEGFGPLCWILLTLGGCQMLHTPNKCNQLPLDLAKLQTKQGHQELVPLLSYLTGIKNKDHKPKGPILVWYWHLFLPGLLYSVMILVAYLVGNRYQGVVGVIALGYLLYLSKNHGHRMHHLCRWPNPLFAGMFGAGIFYSVFTFYVILLPNIEQNIFLLCISTILSVLIINLYWKILTKEPGAVSQSILRDGTDEPCTLRDLCVPPLKVEAFCIHCEIVRKAKVKHCRLCERCFENMDHHCLFLLKCVAKDNHTLFVWFLIVCVACMCLFLLSTLLYCSFVHVNKTMLETGLLMLRGDIWVLSLSIMNLVSLIWGVNLIWFQLKIVSRGGTTYFQSNTDTVLTSTEKLLNVLYFLQGRTPFAIDPLTNSHRAGAQRDSESTGNPTVNT